MTLPLGMRRKALSIPCGNPAYPPGVGAVSCTWASSEPPLWLFESPGKAQHLGSESLVTQMRPNLTYQVSFPGSSDGKESACNAGDLGSIPGSGRSPGKGNGNPLQSSCLGNSMDRRASWAHESVRSQRVGHDWATITHCLAPNGPPSLQNQKASSPSSHGMSL